MPVEAKRVCDAAEIIQKAMAGGIPLAAAVSAALEQKLSVSEKIENCVRLFALEGTNAFPIDKAHVQPALKSLYSRPRGAGWKAWAENHFNPNAGYASQFLFIHHLD